MSAWLRENAGAASQPLKRHALYRAREMARVLHEVVAADGCQTALVAAPDRRRPAKRRRRRPLLVRRNSTSKRASARFRSTPSTCASSVLSERWNLRRAGVLKNRSRTSTVVPQARAAGRGAPTSPPLHAICHACSSRGNARRQREPRDRRDARQRFAAESERRERFEVVERGDLARRVARQCERQLVARNTATVVRDANEARAAGFDVDRDRRCAGVERVLDELLDDGRWPLDDLAGRDLIDELRRQDANRHWTPTARRVRAARFDEGASLPQPRAGAADISPRGIVRTWPTRNTSVRKLFVLRMLAELTRYRSAISDSVSPRAMTCRTTSHDSGGRDAK